MTAIGQTEAPRSSDWRAGSCERPQRWLFRIVVVVALVPFAVAAVRNGMTDWQPTWDAAISVIRVRDVFSAHPPLIGLRASASSGGQAIYSYPGAFLFYLLAVPTRLLGPTWGIQLGMAAVNGAAMAAALWLIRRRVGDRGAILAAVVAGSLLWSLGSEVLVDPTPIQAVIVPSFLFLAAAWSVADGDDPALPMLAAVASYLVQTHVVFLVVVVLVGSTAVLWWTADVRKRRSAGADRPGREASRVGRYLGVALAATLLMWAVPLYDQVAKSGNLGKLARAMFDGGGHGGSTGIVGALGAVVSVTAVPPMWLPPSFAHTPFTPTGGGQPFFLRLLAGSVLLAIVVGVLVVARRRRDRVVERGLVVGVVAWWGWVLTWLVNPNADIFPIHYFLSLWPLAAYMWLVLLLGVLRSIPVRVPSAAGTAAACVALVVVVAGASIRANNCGGNCGSIRDDWVPTARWVRATTVEQMAGHDTPVYVGNYLTFMTAGGPAIALGLQDLGVPFRVSSPESVQQFGSARAHEKGEETSALVLSSDPPPATARLLGVFEPEPDISDARYTAIDRRMRRWAAGDPVQLRDPLAQLPATKNEVLFRFGLENWAKAQAHDRTLVPFARFVGYVDGLDFRMLPGFFDIPGVSRSDVSAWARETVRRDADRLYYYEVPPKPDGS